MKTIILYTLLAGVASFDTPWNTYMPYDQKFVDTGFTQDRLIAVWSSYSQDGDSGGVMIRGIAYDGNEVLRENQVNVDFKGNQTEPGLAVSPNGNLLVAWRGPTADSDSEDILARLFKSNGTALTDDLWVAQNALDGQSYPRVASGPNDLFVITWESESLPDRSKKGIACRLYDANALAFGDEIVVSDRSYTGRYADVAMAPQGDFVVVWLEDRTTDAVFARLFDRSGQPKGDSFQVNTLTFKSLTWPRVDMSATGGFVVTWDGDPNRSSDDDIHARCFDPNGQALGPEFVVNTHRDGAQQDPCIAVNAQGAFVIAWTSDSADTGEDIRAQYLDPNGLLLEPEFQVNQSLSLDQQRPCVTLTDQGLCVISWEGPNEDGTNTDVYYSLGTHPLYREE